MKKNEDMKRMLREAGILAAITIIAGLVLGFVNELTKEPIRLQQEKAVRAACMEVFPEAEGTDMQFQETAYELSGDTVTQLSETGVKIGTVYRVVSGADVRGYVVQAVSTEGYGGSIVIYAGVTAEGILNGISILEISETPGLGMQAEKVLVPQFAKKKADIFTYTKTGSQSENEIDAISGATITTKAVTNAVNGAVRVVQDLTGGQ